VANSSFFETLSHELRRRAARATVSQLGPFNDGLREHLAELLEARAGERGSFLAPPRFEGLFEWEPGSAPIAELGLFPEEMLKALDAPPEAVERYRFPERRTPHRHQEAAWRALLEQKRSVVVSNRHRERKDGVLPVPRSSPICSGSCPRSRPARRSSAPALSWSTR
jgi:DEAD/DEAH box helicase domain-containing protein